MAQPLLRGRDPVLGGSGLDRGRRDNRLGGVTADSGAGAGAGLAVAGLAGAALADAALAAAAGVAGAGVADRSGAGDDGAALAAASGDWSGAASPPGAPGAPVSSAVLRNRAASGPSRMLARLAFGI